MKELKEEVSQGNNKLSFEQAIKELDDYFINSNKNELYKFILAAVEKPLIESVLNKTEGNQSKAAQILGINRNTLHSKIQKLGIGITKCKRD